MFIGHYSVPLVAKAIRPATPVWLLLLAAQFLDVIWAPLVLLGIEKVRIVGGATMADLLDLYYMPYSHSLVAAFVWSGVALVLTKFILRSRGNGAPLLVALVVMSHWVLDLVVHPGDLPLLGDSYKVGFGLWRHTSLSMAIEIGTVAVALWWWLSRADASRAAWQWAAAFMATLIATQFFVFFGPRFSAYVVAVLALLTYFSVAYFGHLIEARIGTSPVSDTVRR
jgi:hypothetical protein